MPDPRAAPGGLGVLQLPRFFSASAETATSAAPGWHVVSGELFHDGQRDEAGTARMQEAIATINQREDQADGVVDRWATTRKDDMATSFQAQRDATYRSFEVGQAR